MPLDEELEKSVRDMRRKLQEIVSRSKAVESDATALEARLITLEEMAKEQGQH